MIYASEGARISAGRQALAAYHNIMIDWYDTGFFSAKKYGLTYEQLEKTVSGTNPQFLAQLGDAVIIAKIGQRRLSEAMERVADNTSVSPLKIPGVMTFQKGVTDEITEFDFSLLGDAGLDLAKVVAQKVEKVGDAADSVLDGATNTIKTASMMLPLVLIFVVGVVGMALFNIGKNVKKVSDVKPI